MQPTLGKNTLEMNEFTENECLPNFQRNESHSHSKLRENALTLTLKGFPLFAHWRGSQKQKTFTFVQVALDSRKKTDTVVISLLSVFRVKFNVEFTRLPVNLSTKNGLFMVHAVINRASVDRFEYFHKYIYIVRHWHN